MLFGDFRDFLRDRQRDILLSVDRAAMSVEAKRDLSSTVRSQFSLLVSAVARLENAAYSSRPSIVKEEP